MYRSIPSEALTQHQPTLVH